MQIPAVQNETGTTTDSCQLKQPQLCSSTLFRLLHTRSCTEHHVTFVADDWWMEADATRREDLNRLGERRRCGGTFRPW